MKSIGFTMLFLSALSFAGITEDIASIKKMTGCYNITYEDAETFSPVANYQFFDRFKSGGLEWIFVERESDKEVVLLHLLIIPGGHIVKHWRQHWTYEDAHIYSFQGDSSWKHEVVSNPVGRWTQAAYQVGGGPRYECSAPWIKWGDVEYWECESNAPLPRREFSIRSDYNILKRRNRHEITAFGHVHSHDGAKISKSVDAQEVIAYEKGRNTYNQIDEASCGPAQTWWKSHGRFWVKAHEAWDEYYALNKDFSIKGQVDGQNLWQHMFKLDQKSVDENWDNLKIFFEATTTIDKFIEFK